MSDETFNKNSGAILTSVLQVEDNLEYFITTYLFGADISQKRRLFFDEILTKPDFTFERKMRLFKKICESEALDSNFTKPLISSIRMMQETRNKVAHWERNGDELKPRTVEAGAKKFTLDKTFMKDFEQNRVKALRGIVDALVLIAKKKVS